MNTSFLYNRILRMIVLLSGLILCLNLFSGYAWATEKKEIGGTCGEHVYWKLSEDGLITVYGKGAMYNYENPDTSSDKCPWYLYLSSIQSVEIQKGVTRIGDYAFCNCSALKSINIPETVTAIGTCSMRKCVVLENIRFSEGIVVIGESAFSYCSSLKTVSFPSTVTEIGRHAFFHAALEHIEIPDSVTKIGIGAFASCEALESAILPDSVTDLSNSLFAGCHSLQSVKLPAYSTVSRMHTDVFRECTALTEVILPQGVTEIRERVFSGCSSLNRVIIPATVRMIVKDTFYDCAELLHKCYPGSAEKWRKVTIENANHNNDPIKKAKLHSYYTYLPYCTSGPQYYNYSYKGSAIKPKIVVRTPSGTTLKKGTNYTIRYENNVDYGRAVVTVSGIGKYFGEVKFYYWIRPKMVQNVCVSSVTNHTAMMTWDPSPDAEKYSIFIGNYKIGETTDTCFKLTGLKAGKTRRVYIRAVVTGVDEEGKTKETMSLAKAVLVITKSD